MTAPIEDQILAAAKALLLAANTGAGTSVHLSRGDADPFDTAELPAINLLLLNDEIETPQTIGAAMGVPVLQLHSLDLVVQVVSASASGAEQAARAIAAQCQVALLQDASLGGICAEAITLRGRQWLRDENTDYPLARNNSLYRCAYRAYAADPFTPI
jgi:hypothetical protein